MRLHSSNTVRAAFGLTIATFLLSAPATLAMQDEDDDRDHRARARFGVVTTQDLDVDHRSLEVVIESGDVIVKMDGEEVPDGQVIREDGTIVIRDAEGNEIRTIKIGERPGHLMDFSFGTGENHFWVADDAEPAPEPAVMLGIQLGSPSPALEHHLRLEPGTTTMIVGLYEGLPAHAAGLGEHDIITHIDGVPADPKSLRAAMAEREPGDVAHMKVIQRGKPGQVAVELIAFDREAMASATLIGSGPRFATATFFGDGPVALGTGDNQWFGEIKDLSRVFIDDDDRVFEFAPGTVPFKEHGENEFFPAEPDREQLDGRLRRLDRRLADLQRVLDALIQEAKRQEEDE